MPTENTQIERVLEHIRENGGVSNLWAFNNFILRLGAIVHRIRHDHGIELVGRWGNEIGMGEGEKKNYYYLTPEKLAAIEAQRA